MAKQTLSNIVRGKHYYRNNFRGTVMLLMVSLLITASLCLFLFYEELTKPSIRFYASSAAGAGFITPLKPLLEPNNSSKYLLEPDLPAEMQAHTLTGATAPAITQPQPQSAQGGTNG